MQAQIGTEPKRDEPSHHQMTRDLSQEELNQRLSPITQQAAPDQQTLSDITESAVAVVSVSAPGTHYTDTSGMQAIRS